MFGQYPDRGSAASAGTDHHHVKNLGAALYLWHPVILSPLEQGRLALIRRSRRSRRAPRQHRSRVILGFPDQLHQARVRLVNLQQQLATFAAAANAARPVVRVKTGVPVATRLESDCPELHHAWNAIYRIIFVFMSQHNAVVVAGHAICAEIADLWNEDSWILLPFQRGEVPFYIEHIEAGVRAAAADPDALLIFTGGCSRLEAGPWSEAQSYYWIADRLDWFGHPEVRRRAITEEFARDSYENLLYSICRAREYTGAYPQHVAFVSWEFKRERFDLHRQSILWPASRFTYLGPNNPPAIDQAVEAETRNRAAYVADPYSSSPAFRAKREVRNPFRRTAGYLQVCPELTALVMHEGPAHYEWPLPWTDSNPAKTAPIPPAASD